MRKGGGHGRGEGEFHRLYRAMFITAFRIISIYLTPGINGIESTLEYNVRIPGKNDEYGWKKCI